MSSGISAARRGSRLLALLVAGVLVGAVLTGCGAAPSASTTSAAATTSNVQHFNVDMSKRVYVPAELDAKAGAPVQITFGQGKGCVQTLVFPAFKIRADMTKGPKTFDLGILQPGDYAWSCGMNMQHGVLKVR
jgi:plastocyanin domain-containing protein